MLWLFLIFIVLLAGFIAYAGDEVGRRVGRKHFRLFGLRPKTTALIYAIASGMLISLVSVLGFALLNQKAIRDISQADALRLEVQQLKTEVEPLQKNIALQQKALETSQVQRELAQIETSRALKAVKVAITQRETLRKEVKTLEENSRDLASKNVLLSQRADDLERSVGTAEERIKTIETQRIKQEQDLKANQLELSTRQKQLIDLRNQRQELQTQALSFQNKISNLQNTSQILTREKTILEKQKNALEGQKIILEKQKTTLEAQSKQIRLQNTQLGNELRGERQNLEKTRNDFTQLQNRSTILQIQANRLTLESEQLKKAKLLSQQDLDRLNQLRSKLQDDNNQLRLETQKLSEQQNQLRKALENQKTELEAQKTGDFAYQKGDLVFESVLQKPDLPSLNAVLQRAMRVATAKGAKGTPSSVMSDLEKTALLERLGSDASQKLVILRSGTNVVRGYPLRVYAEMIPDTLLFQKAQPMGSKLIAVGTANNLRSSEDLRTQIDALVESVIQTLQQQGMPLENILEAGLSDQETFELISKLKSIGGGVLVGIASRQDVRPSAKIELYSVILR